MTLPFLVKLPEKLKGPVNVLLVMAVREVFVVVEVEEMLVVEFGVASVVGATNGIVTLNGSGVFGSISPI